MQALWWDTVVAASPAFCINSSAAMPACSFPTPASLNTVSQGRASMA
jgi:hypothetical protein